jgi:hypothetical protein
MLGPILKSEPELLRMGFERCANLIDVAFHFIQPFNITRTCSLDKLETFPHEPA